MVMGELAQETEVLVIGSGPGGYAAALPGRAGCACTRVASPPRPSFSSPSSFSTPSGLRPWG